MTTPTLVGEQIWALPIDGGTRAMLEVRLLGEQGVAGGTSVDGRPPSSRSVALLAYLALRAGAAQSRQHLAGIFWPESSESQARTNLRRELHQLRILLDSDLALVVTPTTLMWSDSASCRVDVRTFERERAAALAALARADHADVSRHAVAAVEQYRGDLMPSLYDDWVLDERDRLRQECVDLCASAVPALRAAGDLQRATELARRRIQLDPLGESGYLALMELQAEAGDRAAAMSTYHRCAAVLEAELGVTPDPKTQAAVERLLGRGGGATRTRGRGAGERSGAGRPGLIDREPELAVLLDSWAGALRGRTGLVLVSGEAGVGKSRLVAELTEAAVAEGAAVATTRCFGSSGRLPLAPVAAWLRSEGLRAAVESLDPVWQSEVQRLVPLHGGSEPVVVAGRGTAGSRAMADSWQRHRFFEGLARAALAAGRPTLLVLDDLQWCDQETMAWLGFLLRFAENAQLLVAATVRAEEQEENRGVQVALRDLRSAGLLTEISLAPLGPEGTEELARSVRGRPLSPVHAAFLHAATGGYPLFVVEAARSLPDDESPAAELPAADLAAVLRHRLEQTSPAGQEVAGLAAAVGRDFSLDLLIEASDLDAETLVRAVDELWRRRILREQPLGYDFSHDLLRDAAYAGVSPAQRWLLHRRLAQGLELMYAGHLDDVAAQLAEQYDRGGRPDRALRYLDRSAVLAEAVFANAEAVRHRRRSLELVLRGPAGRVRDGQELDVLRAMTRPLNALAGYSDPELQHVLERSVMLAERLGQTDVVIGGLVGLFSSRYVQGNFAQAHELGIRALALAEAGSAEDSTLASQAHFAFAGSATGLGRHASAITHFQRACDLSSGAVSLIVGTRLEVHAKAWAAHAHWLLGDDDSALAESDDAVRIAREAEHPYSLVVSLAYAAITHQLLGEVDAVRTCAAELDQLCRRHEFAYYGEWAVILGGWAAGGDDGVAQMRSGIARLRTQGSLARMPYWLSLLAERLIGAGQIDAARAVLDGARATARQNDERWWLPEVLRLRARLEPGAGGVGLLRQALVSAAAEGSRLELRCRADLADRGRSDDGRERSAAFAGSAGEANAERTPDA